MEEVIAAGGTPCLHTFPSSAVRLCQVAADKGIDLRGAYFAVVGEPLTAARLVRIHSVGASVVPVYGSTEAGRIGYGCCRPSSPDDVHFLNDLLALIQPGGETPGVFPDHALLVSSLRPTAPFVLLNVSLGDQGIVGPSRCGCPMEELGWDTHIHAIRSYEKLTTAGMTFLYDDISQVLEEDLPARFGGGPTQYQLIEEEDETGDTHLKLLVDPAVGPLDEVKVRHAFLSAIGRVAEAQKIMATVWDDISLPAIERRRPTETPSGKILSFIAVREQRQHGAAAVDHPPPLG